MRRTFVAAASAAPVNLVVPVGSPLEFASWYPLPSVVQCELSERPYKDDLPRQELKPPNTLLGFIGR